MFTFLNLSKSFNGCIDWNFPDYGKLWNYNLQYIDFINEEALPERLRLEWVNDLYQNLFSGQTALEPYPVSLRSMNVMRFLSQGARIKAYPDLVESVEAELTFLHDNYEYHILGNHLLENAFAMYMGATFFNNRAWKKRASAVLREQLDEQILEDGAHFELSPMYHQIVLFRVLELISYVQREDPIVPFVKEKAGRMLGWLTEVSFNNGDLPHFNDSSEGIAYTTAQLLEYASAVAVPVKKVSLGSSGYRKVLGKAYECLIDVHGISPVYQPGHNHADHLSFVLYIHDRPFIIDPGTSTYDKSARRQWERSSRAHNTVTVADDDQSEVWGGFRVGRRARVNIISDLSVCIRATAKYFSPKIGKEVFHEREFIFTEGITIRDTVDVTTDAVARLYLHPKVDVSQKDDSTVVCNGNILIQCPRGNISIKGYSYSLGYNRLIPAKVLELTFQKDCETSIQITS